MSGFIQVRWHHHEETVPKPALWAALTLIVVSVGLAATSRQEVAAAALKPPAAPAHAERMLRFEDRPDGSIVVLDERGREVRRVRDNEGNGFIRGVLRGLFRARKLDGLAREAPFRLAREADGRLTLTDTLTSRRIDLQAFGATNSAAFDALLRGTEVADAR